MQHPSTPCAFLPIAPCWNWNSWGLFYHEPSRHSQSHHAGIETLIAKKYTHSKMALPIAPCWNWNDGPVPVGCVCWTPNRTMLELKRISVPSLIRSQLAPNRTMLELKLSMLFRILLLASSSQSHHAGIETMGRCLSGACAGYSQSHHAGIETFVIVKAQQSRGFSQSHHAGIETTLLTRLICCVGFSQSHHAGIETLAADGGRFA